ncbi:MAG: rod shape-determining protein [Planctomycetes bacterium]|nr:rod shape-determining protein [Planctomycetota bacterium]
MSATETKAKPEAKAETAQKTALRVGFDLGTNTSVFQVSKDGKRVQYSDDVVTTIVGYSKRGILPGILPKDATMLFGQAAIEYRLHLDLKWPLKAGHVFDVQTCRDFIGHMCSCIDPEGKSELWAVFGAPANSTPDKVKLIRSVAAGHCARMLVVPEPFLAAMGMRDEESVGKPGYNDPTKHSLIVDIGAGTTDLCIVRGYYPDAEDEVSFDVAGDAVDEALRTGIQRRYPDLQLSRVTVTQLKEKYSFVGDGRKDAMVKLYVDGKPRMLDISSLVREACENLVQPILSGIKQLLRRCDSDTAESILQNIIVAGGGSQISGLSETIQSVLREEGYDCATTLTPPDYKRLVALGALKVADSVRDDQWQIPM